MAEVTLLHLLNLRDNDDDDIEEDLLSDFSETNMEPYWSNDFDVFDSDMSSGFPFPDLLPRRWISMVDSTMDDVPYAESVITPADLCHRENQVNFVMDLFHQRVEQSQLSETHVVIDPDLDVSETCIDPNFELIEGNDEIDSNQLDLDLGLGFYGERSSPNGGGSVYGLENFDRRMHFATGLRLVDIELDSDSDVNVDAGIHEEDDDMCDLTDVDDRSLCLCLDSLQIEDHREANEDFEWEDVAARVDEREVLNTFLDDVDVPVTAREERVAMISNWEWEELLNSPNLESSVEAGLERFDFWLGDHELGDYDHELLFGQFVENENPIMGKPPAAKEVVKNLPVVVLSKEDSEKNNVICAVCRDEMGVGEMARQLPCNHRYHGDCILPWLGIRNTCPVCRYELPTDDPDYERRKERIVGQVH